MTQEAAENLERVLEEVSQIEKCLTINYSVVIILLINSKCLPKKNQSNNWQKLEQL